MPDEQPPKMDTQRRAGAERYRRGARRTSAEPLVASWDPVGDGALEDEKEQGDTEGDPPRRGAGGLLSAHRWPVYLVPVLLVVTVLAVLDTRDEASTGQPRPDAPVHAGGSVVDASEGTVLPESPDAQFDPGVVSAELPGGREYSQKGDGTFRVVPGGTEQAGEGKLYTYTVEVENGIEWGGSDEEFQEKVDATLSDPRSWIGDKNNRRAVQRIDDPDKAHFRVRLTSPATTAEICGKDVKYESSCRSGRLVTINLARWVRGARPFQGDLGLYREYLINHEVGHFFGGSHVPCTEHGALAPVMMQQSWSTSNDDLAKIIEGTIQGGARIPADGKVCRPNAWPFPTQE
ncbi:MAG TPA: DUF3152 domain-containing protein [Pseudonocardiaceae bacterium]